MVTYIDSHIFHLTSPLTKTGGEDVVDGNDWNDAVKELGRVALLTSADSPYTALETDQLICCDCTSGAITVNLTSAATYDAKSYVIIKTDSSGNDVTVDPDGSETINGSATALIESQYQSLEIESDGTNWLKISPESTGETNLGANVGTGDGQIFRDKSGVTLNFKRLIAGSNVTITNGADDVTIAAAALSAAIDDLTDVVITAAADGDFLRYNGTNWVDATISATDLPAHASRHTTGGADAIGTDFITGRTEDASPSSSNDFVLTYDASATALKKVKLTNLPGGSSTTIGYEVPAAQTSAGINTALGSTPYQCVKLESAVEYDCTVPITLTQNGQYLDGQHGILQVTAAFAAGDDEVVTIGGASAGSSKDNQHVENVIIDFNNEADHPQGIGTYDSTGSGSPTDKITKFMRINDIAFLNHNDEGKTPLYLRNCENMCIISNISIPSLANNTIGIVVEDLANDTVNSANHGNIDLSHCRVSLSPGCTGIKVKSGTFGGSDLNDPLNRVKIAYCQAFIASKTNTDGTVGYDVEPGDTGGTQNSRHWSFDHITAEDCTTSFLMERSASASGVWGLELTGFGFEDKQDSSFTTTRTAIKINSAGFEADIHDGRIMCQVPGASNDSVGIDLTNMGTSDVITIHDVTFLKKSGSGTFTPIKAISGKTGVYVRNCPGYNPVGTISSPWKSTGLFNEVSGGSSSPTSNTTYTVYNTKKRITLAGGTVSQIQINGTSTGLTSGSFVLEPGETIRITHSVAPTTAVVYCY